MAEYDKRDAFTSMSSFVHQIFMSGILCFAFFIHDIYFFGLHLRWISWLLIFIFLFLVGFIADNQCDQRGTVILREHRKEYKQHLNKYR